MKIVEEIMNTYEDCEFYEEEEFIMTEHQKIINKNHQGVVLIYSELVNPDNYKSNSFGSGIQYHKDCVKEYDRMKDINSIINFKYKDKVQTILSDWNEPCQLGCCIYVYIYEEDDRIEIEEYIENNKEIGCFYYKWLVFAPSFDFKLSNDYWGEVFDAFMEGVYDLDRIDDKDVQGECIITIPQYYCFYGTGIFDNTIYHLNEILKNNNINIKYTFDYKLRQVNEEERW